MSRKALGRGLKALIPDTKPPDQSPLLELQVEQVLPGRFQPRQDFDAEKIRDLAESIKARGVIQPVVVRQIDGDRYELIAGERRWRAAREAGLQTIPALIRRVDDPEALEMALVENLQREDLNPIEAARAYQLLAEKFDLTQEQIAAQTGKDRTSIANHLRLLKLPGEVQEELVRGRLAMGHARAILALPGREKQLQACTRIIARGLSVRETEKLVRTLSAPASKKPGGKPKKDIYIKDLEDRIRRSLGTKVSIRPAARGGTIEISYFTQEDLERLMEHLTARD